MCVCVWHTESFEVATSNCYVRRTQAGEFVVVNRQLQRDLLARGLWTPELAQQLIADQGSVQKLAIPARLKEMYRTVWEVTLKSQTDRALDRAAFIDQGQSFNVHMRDCTPDKLSRLLIYAWERGAKNAMYYLRTEAAADPLAASAARARTAPAAAVVAPPPQPPAPAPPARPAPLRPSAGSRAGGLGSPPPAGDAPAPLHRAASWTSPPGRGAAAAEPEPPSPTPSPPPGSDASPPAAPAAAAAFFEPAGGAAPRMQLLPAGAPAAPPPVSGTDDDDGDAPCLACGS